MKSVGIVVEYNPFHNGHLYHVEQAKISSGADVVIAVMSGNFLQRGEPAFVDKWYRTKMALQNGVDLVIELPYVYSTGTATTFAEGAIYLLNSIGCEFFAFGSEDGNIEPFLNTANLLNHYNDEYQSLIKHYIGTGISYPQSLFNAYEQLKQKEPLLYIDLSKPNNILGYHYIEAANRLNLSIKPLTIKRIEADYHSTNLSTSSTIASATSIRKAILEKQNLEEIKRHVPSHSFELLLDWTDTHRQFMRWESFWPLLKYAILRYTPEDLTQFADVSEGIEYSLIKNIKNSESFLEFMKSIKSKRYTWTRLQRLLTHIYTGITKKQLHQFDHPTYIRLLGMSKNGQHYLSNYKKEFELPLISRVAAIKDPMLSIDLRASFMYAQGVQLYSDNQLNRDYKTPPIRI